MHIEQKRIFYSAVPVLLFLFVLWIVKVIELSFNLDFSDAGIYPLKPYGLTGIITHPFIHSDVLHLLSNTLPLFILGWTLFYFYADIAPVAFLIIFLLSGFCTWLIGGSGCHIGASGLIYGLSFFLFFSGIMRKNKKLLAISLFVAFLYGSTVWSMTPIAHFYKTNISWQGHLSGAISGLFTSVMLRKKGPENENTYDDEESDNPGQDDELTREALSFDPDSPENTPAQDEPRTPGDEV